MLEIRKKFVSDYNLQSAAFIATNPPLGCVNCFMRFELVSIFAQFLTNFTLINFHSVDFDDNQTLVEILFPSVLSFNSIIFRINIIISDVVKFMFILIFVLRMCLFCITSRVHDEVLHHNFGYATAIVFCFSFRLIKFDIGTILVKLCQFFLNFIGQCQMLVELIEFDKTTLTNSAVENFIVRQFDSIVNKTF